MSRLERDLEGRAVVLRLDLLSGVGREAARNYGVKAVPAMVVFNRQGQIVLKQTGMIDTGAVRDIIARLEP